MLKKLMKYKSAITQMEAASKLKAENPDVDDETLQALVEQKCSTLQEKGLLIKQWDLDFIEADLAWCGREGSPTKVHRIQSVVLSAKEAKDVAATSEGVTEMIHELIVEKTIS